MRPTTQKQASKRAEIAVRRHKALELKIAGHSDRAIARILDVDAAGDHWLHLVGKGGKPARVTLTPLARTALERHLLERWLPVSLARWNPPKPIVGSLDGGETGITPLRLWEVMHRFFRLAANTIEGDHPALAEKLRRAIRQWMRHSHATHALAKGVERKRPVNPS